MAAGFFVLLHFHFLNHLDTTMKSDIEIARSIELKKIKQVAESVGIPREEAPSAWHWD